MIWAVLIVDSLPCLFRLFLSAKDVIDGQVRYLLLNHPRSLLSDWVIVIGIGLFGLSGNILVLLKKKAGFPLAIASVLLVVLSDGQAVWEHRHEANRGLYYFMLIFILFRFAWLVFYGVILHMAAKRLYPDPGHMWNGGSMK